MTEKALVGGVTITSLYLDEDVNRNFSCTESREKGGFMEDTQWKPAILAVSSAEYPPFSPAFYVAKIPTQLIPSEKTSKTRRDFGNKKKKEIFYKKDSKSFAVYFILMVTLPETSTREMDSVLSILYIKT